MWLKQKINWFELVFVWTPIFRLLFPLVDHWDFNFSSVVSSKQISNKGLKLVASEWFDFFFSSPVYEAALSFQPGLVDEHDAVSEVLGPEQRGPRRQEVGFSRASSDLLIGNNNL